MSLQAKATEAALASIRELGDELLGARLKGMLPKPKVAPAPVKEVPKVEAPDEDEEALLAAYGE